MSTTEPMEDFFPFEVPPGNHSTMDNWRKMAQLWCADGVIRANLGPVPSEPNPLSVYGWDWANSRCTVAPGACWVNGFYGANQTAKVLDVGAPPQWGLVVARYDPRWQTVAIIYREGIPPTGAVRDPEGVWELPLAQMNSDGGIADLRRLVPLPDLTPQLPAIPSWVPKGMLPQGAWGWTGGPAGNWDIVGPTTVNISVLYAGSTSWFIPGRTYRWTASVAIERWADGQGQPGGALDFYVNDSHGMRRRERLLNQNEMSQGSGFSGRVRSTSLTVNNAGEGALSVLELSISNANNIWRVLDNSISMACEDVGL